MCFNGCPLDRLPRFSHSHRMVCLLIRSVTSACSLEPGTMGSEHGALDKGSRFHSAFRAPCQWRRRPGTGGNKDRSADQKC